MFKKIGELFLFSPKLADLLKQSPHHNWENK